MRLILQCLLLSLEIIYCTDFTRVEECTIGKSYDQNGWISYSCQTNIVIKTVLLNMFAIVAHVVTRFFKNKNLQKHHTYNDKSLITKCVYLRTKV